MASEIEEIKEDSQPKHVNPHSDNTMKNDDSNSNISGNRDGEREKDKKIKDGMKCILKRVLCRGGSETKSSSQKKNKSVDIKFQDGGCKFDALLPYKFHEDHFKQSSFFKDFCESFEGLGSPQKKCLSSFILFSGNRVVKKSLLVDLWNKEGFLNEVKQQGEEHEDIATKILDDFVAKKFVLPVIKKFQKGANSFKIDRDVHFTMILLGKSAGSRSDGNIFSWFDNKWECCSEKSKQLEPKNPEEVKTLLNVNMESLDFKLESFSKMKNVEVLDLGRKQGWDHEHHHIDVTKSEFLEGLKNMKKLSFLGLQGISGIQELPSSISNLTSLKTLDLRACYNLEKLPKEIGSLKKLTHLDISECYLLDCMPRELLSLSELQVMKGFVVTDIKYKSLCTLDELSGLKKLRKLSVNLNSVTFSIDKFSVVLKFKPLVKLKITWECKVSMVNQNKNSKQAGRQSIAVREVRSSGTKLQKLELQCLPHKTLPNWVTPESLTSLKKLYIRGGGLQSLGAIDQKWNVEVLRLKYLTQLKINWRELMTMFPKLQYLEKFKCPQFTLSPCDCYGVWVKSPEEEPVAQP